MLAKRIEALFRAVPPLYLALGMTEKEVKAERRALMREHHCSELDAAKQIARKLDRLRGLTDAHDEEILHHDDVEVSATLCLR